MTLIVPAALERGRVSHALAVGAALVVVTVARTGGLSLAVAAAGCLALVAGLGRRSRPTVVLASVALFASTLLVAVTSGRVLAVLAGAFGSVLAADFGAFAVGLDRDVDASVATARVELLHAVGSLSAAVVTGALGVAFFRSAPTGSPLGVAALLFAAVVLAVALRASDSRAAGG